MVPTLHAPLRTSPPPSALPPSPSASFSACWHRCLPFLLPASSVKRVHAGDVTPVIQPGCSTWPVTKCQCPRSAPRKFPFFSSFFLPFCTRVVVSSSSPVSCFTRMRWNFFFFLFFSTDSSFEWRAIFHGGRLTIKGGSSDDRTFSLPWMGTSPSDFFYL